MALPRSERPERAVGPAARLTGRGAVLTMAGLFLVGLLAAALVGWTMLAGLAFLVGCVLAARYTASADLLTVVVSPPLLFVGLMVLVSAATGPGSLLLSVVVGSVGTLIGAAPWLAAGLAVTVAIAWARGLRRCIRDLIHELGSGLTPGQPRATRAAAATSGPPCPGAAPSAGRTASAPGPPRPPRPGRSRSRRAG
jgi:hypothetical protein